MNMHKLCLIVPTKDRPFELERLLKSMEGQDILPDQVIVVDGGNPGIKWLTDKFPRLAIDYLQVLPPGLTRQYNAGIRAVREDIDLVGMLDDDIILEKGCLSSMMNFWEKSADRLGGAGFNIVNAMVPKKRWWTSFISLTTEGNKRRGALLKSGRNVSYCPATFDLETEWLCSGATVWKKKIFNEYQFDEWFAGYGIVDDIDFSYRVSKNYKLAVVANARVQHLETGDKDYFFWAYVVTMNHIYLSFKHREFSQSLCALSFLNDGIKLLTYGILSRNKSSLYQGAGYIWAVLRRIFLGIHRVEKQVKPSKDSKR